MFVLLNYMVTVSTYFKTPLMTFYLLIISYLTCKDVNSYSFKHVNTMFEKALTFS